MPSQCPRCENSRFTVEVPADLTAYTDAAALDCCPRCLSSEPGDSAAVDPEPPFETVVRRFPTGTEGVALFLLLGELDSLALNRSEIESLVDRLESNDDVAYAEVGGVARQATDTVVTAEEVRSALQALRRKGVVEVVYRTVPTFKLAVERDSVEVSVSD